MQYKLVRTYHSIPSFNEEINQHLKEGWILYGETFTSGTHRDYFCQALVKTETKDTKQ